jgi:Kef-type K+ transport system membrane component KefB
METDFSRLRKSVKSSLLISLLGVAAALGGGFLVAFLFGNPTFESFFIGVIIASMSTSITVETLNEMGKLKTKIGTTLMGASLFDDVFVIVILALIMGTSGGAFSIGAMGLTLLKIIVFFVFAIIAGILINKFFNWFYGRFGNRSKLTIFAIAYCFLMAYLAEVLGLADITGAYLAGIAFCNSRCDDMLEEKTHNLSYLFFTPIFLANIGIHTSFYGMTGSLVLFTIALVVVAIVTKLVGCGLGAKISRFTNRESLQVGVGMVARGEVSFIVAAKGIAVGYVSATMYPSIIVVVLVTVFVTPMLLKAAFSDRKASPPGDHMIEEN